MGLWSSIKSIGSKILPAVGSAIGGIPGAIVGGAVDLVGQYLGNKYISAPNAQNAFENSMYGSAYAFDRTREAYQSRYQDTMADMAAAGLNPILAAGSGGFQVGNAVQMDAPKGFLPQIPNITPSSAYKNMMEGNLDDQRKDEVRVNIEKMMIEAEKTIEEKLLVIQQTNKTRIEAGVADKEEKRLIQEIENLKVDWWLKVGIFKRTMQEAYKLNSEQKLNLQKIEELKSQKKHLDKIVEKMDLEMASLKRIADNYNGPLGALYGGIKTLMDMLNMNMGMFLPVK